MRAGGRRSSATRLRRWATGWKRGSPPCWPGVPGLHRVKRRTGMIAESPILTTHHTLKEWAVAIQALREGDGIITVRKGGIREDAREFRMEHRRFAFFPTY